MKLAVAQFNPTVGDIEHNLTRMLPLINKAARGGADLIVFPELSVLGYPPRDLLGRSEIISRVWEALQQEIIPASYNIGILLGAPARNPGSDRLYNAALLYHGGGLSGRQDKTLLPNYDVFDESRYFSPAKQWAPLTFQGEKLGVTICEDIWNDKDYWDRQKYEIDPVEKLMAQGAEYIINLSASPYHYGKRRLRAAMLGAVARKYRKNVIYVNQVGGNDELIFDGSSMVFDVHGKVLWQGKPFEEDFVGPQLKN